MTDGFAERAKATIAAYMAAFNARDMDALGLTLSDDVTLVDWSVSAAGKDAVLATTGTIVASAELRITVLGILVEEPNAVADLLITIDGTTELAVIDLFAFTPDGRIRSVRAFRGPERPRA